MKLWAKIAIGTGITTAVVAGINYFKNLSRADAELESSSRAMIHEADLDGVVIRVDVTLKNPTRATFKIKYPFVKLIYQGATIASSQVINKDIILSPFGQVEIKEIMISMSLANLFSAAYSAVKKMISGEAVALKVKTISTISLGWKSLAYEKAEDVTLKHASAKPKASK